MKHPKPITAFCAVTLAFLVSCGPQYGCYERDQELRQKIFKECLALIPKGPDKTVYNDWAEVIAECESAASYQSLKCEYR